VHRRPVSKDRRDAPAPASLIVDRRKGQDVKEDSDEDETPALFDPTAEVPPPATVPIELQPRQRRLASKIRFPVRSHSEGGNQ